MTKEKQIIYLTGLPRTGSTLLANILAMHPQITSTPSSPLCQTIQNMRRSWSDDPFLLSQLDEDIQKINKRLIRATKSFMQSWCDETENPIVVDKNRGWLFLVETLKLLYPNYKMIVCLRDLKNILASIEKQHRKTLMLDFPDHMEHNIIDKRASALFDDNGVIGGPLKALYNLGDIPTEQWSKNIYFWKFEQFLADPKVVTDHLFEWLNLEKEEIDFDNIKQSTFESDSWYRFKYPHKIYSKITLPEPISNDPNETGTKVSPRILSSIMKRFEWYYKDHYPEVVQAIQKSSVQDNNQNLNSEDEELAQELDLEIEKEVGTPSKEKKDDVPEL